MSNQAVGNVYQTIIEEVINSSRVDFEESGIEESVLEELRQVSDPSCSYLSPWPCLVAICHRPTRGTPAAHVLGCVVTGQGGGAIWRALLPCAGERL